MTPTKPSPYQYLLDIIAAQRIEEATTPAEKAEAIRRWEGITEKEVIFANEKYKYVNGTVRHDYYTIAVLANRPGRAKFSVPAFKFRTGTLDAMLRKNADIPVDIFANIAKSGFYIEQRTGALHLLIPKESNIWEMLKFTGYEYKTSNYRVVWYDDIDPTNGACGHIDISYNFVAGRIFITNQTKFFDKNGDGIPDAPNMPKMARMVAEPEPTLTEDEELAALLAAEEALKKAELEAAGEVKQEEPPVVVKEEAPKSKTSSKK